MTAALADSKRASIDRLQALSAKLPQLQLDTKHLFAAGMYARVLQQPADSLVVGKAHKSEHFFIVCRGAVLVSHGDGPAYRAEAGTVFVSQPGAKRAISAESDAVYMTVHRTDKTDLNEIEAELIEPDPLALFDAFNMPRLA